MREQKYSVGEYVRFKKEHPCGGDVWEVLRIGADFKVKCTTCGRLIMLSRRKFEKSVKEKVSPEN
ncbi:MAG: DUF951 domain-containing protein [Halanaerobiales bacterium]